VTALTPVEREERRRRRRRQELFRWGIRVGLALLLFLLGVGLGQALHDNPKPGSTITLQRTLHIPTGGNPASTVTP
jgi:type VI protein secretion system component VasF